LKIENIFFENMKEICFYTNGMMMILQFFTQSNPLNNLNNITSNIPPILQRQNSAPTTPQQQQSSNSAVDFLRATSNNVIRPSNPPQTTPNVDIQRKYSLPMNTLATNSQQQQNISQPMNHQLIRKQSAPTIPSFAPTQPPPVPPHQTIHPKIPTTTTNSSITTSNQQPQQSLREQTMFQNSPSRARDRNQFDQVSLNQDVQQLPLLKGGKRVERYANFISCSHFFRFLLFH
jgi:hypothetical protein